MIKIIDSNIDEELDRITRRVSLTLDRSEEPIVKSILKDIVSKGDRSLLEYTNKFDRTNFKSIEEMKVSTQELESAYDSIDESTLKSLRQAIINIKEHHQLQKHESWMHTHCEGAQTGIKYSAIGSVGVYVPGGTAAYPSSVLMNVIPAQIAGVKRIVMVTPPDSEGKLTPLVLVAANELGIKEIYKVGGAQAVGALAFGTDSIVKVDKIVGPGNIWVTIAKKLVYGVVAIDKLAGPSDITVLADPSAPASYVAADLLSQAEHDSLASSIAVVLSADQANQIKDEIIKQTAKLDRQDIVEQSLRDNSAIFVVDSIEKMVNISNAIAPEHLELMFDDYECILPHITNAGAIFCGYYCPEPLGDYFAGPNHVLPTGGTARFESPLGVDDFIKRTSILKYTKEATRKVIDDIEILARLEGLDAHAASIAIRR